MSWIERAVEERLRQAAESGELATPHLHGKPLADLDQQRSQGWWADQFARRELSHDRRVRAEADAARARAGFWRAASADEVRSLVAAANDTIMAANVNLVAADRIEPFDADDIVRRWRVLSRD